ncbi:MAG: hypothetical protein WBG92_02015, partial [Thiohalocapsa sp.]
MVWRRLDTGQTQQMVADGIGWSRETAKNYAALRKIDSAAWAIVGTTFKNIVPDEEGWNVPGNGTGVPGSPFSENRPRNILDLEPAQQLDLCQKLAKGGIC